MTHLKKLNAPKSWPLKNRKGNKFIARPMPGPHKLTESVTLNLILKEFLNYTKTAKDTKLILNQGMVLVNDKIRKDHKFPVGLMDIISIKDTNEHFILIYNTNLKFTLFPIKKEEAQDKIAKITGKTILKKNKIQLNLYNGYNLLVEKDTYKTGDSIILNKNKIKKHLKFEKGAIVYLTGGKHKGHTGILEATSSNLKNTIVIKTGDAKLTTKKDYAFVIEKPFKK